MREKQEEFNDQIRAIFSGGKIHKIIWGDEFYAWNEKVQLEYVKEVASAMNQAAKTLDERNVKLIEESDFLKKSVESLEQALEINKNIMRNTLTNVNAEKEKHAQELQKRDNIIKELQLENKLLNGLNVEE